MATIANLLPTYGILVELEPNVEDLLPTYGLVLGSQEAVTPPATNNPPLITLVT